ncbi:MAG TPA: polysaccharide biosynthesis/export family protein [Verrucomicrobiales bacterium]|nr:polysaccharide biosynthesis/export family protein [Verrucomicrobiales bacterium]
MNRPLFLAAFLAGISALGFPVRAQNAPAAGVVTDGAYQIQAQDRVKISVYDEPDLAADQRVDKGGTIAIPLLGSVRIAGMTIRNAERSLEARFVAERYLRNPKVTISIEEYSKRQVTVLGQVAKPGVVEFAPEQEWMDLVDVIAQGGGFTNTAKKKEVRVTRGKGTAAQRIISVNFYDLLKDRRGRGGAQSFRVLPGDSIYVPERLF